MTLSLPDTGPIPSTHNNHSHTHPRTHIKYVYILYYVIYLYVILFTCSAGKKYTRARGVGVCVCVCVCVKSPSHRHPRFPRHHYGLLRCTQNIWSYTICCCYYYYYRRRRCYKSCNDNIISLREYIYIYIMYARPFNAAIYTCAYSIPCGPLLYFVVDTGQSEFVCVCVSKRY